MKVFSSILLIIAAFSSGFGQSQESDLLLLQQQRVKHAKAPPVNGKRTFNPLALLYKGTMGVYQHHISPQWGANCAFETTCSHFSKQLVHEFGLAKGFFLTLDRLGRCNKISFYETLPIRINAQGKIIDRVEYYRFRL